MNRKERRLAEKYKDKAVNAVLELLINLDENTYKVVILHVEKEREKRKGVN